MTAWQGPRPSATQRVTGVTDLHWHSHPVGYRPMAARSSIQCRIGTATQSGTGSQWHTVPHWHSHPVGYRLTAAYSAALAQPPSRYRLAAAYSGIECRILISKITWPGLNKLGGYQKYYNNRDGTYGVWALSKDNYGHLMVMNCNQYGRALILHNIRKDLTARSVPPPGSREATHVTYEDYFVEHWTRKNREAYVLTDCPLIEVHSLLRRRELLPLAQSSPKTCNGRLPAHEARFQLGLPPIADDLLIKSTALPTTNANWNLETLGDSVLKLITTSSMSNRALLARATEIERFLTSEGQNVHVWRYTVPEGEDVLSHMLNSYHAVQRSFPRRSLQDCMEATLGAAFLMVHLYGGPHQSRGARMLHRQAWKTGLKLYYWNENFHFLVANISWIEGCVRW
ncbi:hypothetical protein EDD15DRAFT_2193602 [Pisolithus albus]|nr:hypothetical protein EDD15DRAFT_2193602 [Pisolithus albus]